jgi:hypothetical protein
MYHKLNASKSCSLLVFYFPSIYVKSDDRWIVRILGRTWKNSFIDKIGPRKKSNYILIFMFVSSLEIHS